ncbi:PstS family phosphate ABC transporter substrate-binding protein [Glaciecola sp. 1036]|uniref:PstS family phosphate ABC transporter substrate-binding protein n=1 Tax=Alteromonadaceae TaxID=72275 RepID=UPI003CFCFD8B
MSNPSLAWMKIGFFCCTLFLVATSNGQQSDTVTLPEDYKNTPGVFGSVTSIGSDTLANLMAIWADQFQQYYPHVKFQMQATGSATASQALTQGTASIGPMSRALTEVEIDRFIRQYGYPPTALIVAIDAISIYTERSNPIERLTIAQVDAIFSATRFCGYRESIVSWEQLGVKKFGAHRQIQIFGRNSASGTYDLFKKLALCGGDYAVTTNEMPSSSSIVQSVAASIGGIGYAALGPQNRNVKPIAISQDGENYYLPNAKDINANHYPFTRFLYIVVNKPPEQPLPTLEDTFLRFVLSAEGQSLVSSTNYYPVTGRALERQLRLLSGNLK